MIGTDSDGCIVCGVLWDVPAVSRTDNCQFVTSLMKFSQQNVHVKPVASIHWVHQDLPSQGKWWDTPKEGNKDKDLGMQQHCLKIYVWLGSHNQNMANGNIACAYNLETNVGPMFSGPFGLSKNKYKILFFNVCIFIYLLIQNHINLLFFKL